MLSILVKDHHVQQMVGQGSFTDLLAEWSLAISKQYNLYRQRDPDLAKAFQLMMRRCMDPDSPVWDADPVEGLLLVSDDKGGARHD